MSYCDQAKWTCPHPGCSHSTVTVYATVEDTRAALDAVMTRHAKEHQKAERVATRVFTRAVEKAAPVTGHGKLTA